MYDSQISSKHAKIRLRDGNIAMIAGRIRRCGNCLGSFEAIAALSVVGKAPVQESLTEQATGRST